jgi:MinD superfamily P-loop ATPase
VEGLLNIGEAMSPPVIRQVKAAAPPANLVIVDSPPGTSCPVVESVRGSDYVILVTEPTPFGLHDLRMAVDLLRTLRLPFGVVVNRARDVEDSTTQFCRTEGIEVLAAIPDDRRIAEAYSMGELMCRVEPKYWELFEALLNTLDLVCPLSETVAEAIER